MTNLPNTPALDAALEALRKDLRAQGAKEAAGEAARPDAALKMADAAHEGQIGEDFAEEGYRTYLAGKRKAQGNSPLARVAAESGKPFDAQVSKFRQCIKVSVLSGIDGPAILRRAAELAKKLEGPDTKTLAPFEAMLAVARAQLKDATRELTDDEISEIVIVTKPEKPELADLIAAYKAAHKLAGKYPMPETEQAISIYRDAIVKAGGEVPAVTKEEKKEAEAMAFLKSKGMVPVHAIAAE